MNILILLLALLAQEVRVSVNPALSLPPATVRAVVTVPRHPDNRKLIIILADEEEISVSEIPLHGDNEQPQFVRIFDHLSEGRYRVTAILQRNGKQFQAIADFQVGVTGDGQ